MAPCRRSIKNKGMTRMDAALDAMRSYGFPEQLIVDTIKELLDVYYVDGWHFIEEASYRVLFDNILEKLEKEAKNDSKGGENTKSSAAGSSTMALAPICSNREAMAIELQSTASPAKDVPENALLTEGTEGNACLLTAEGEGSSGMDMNIEEDWKKKPSKNAEGTQKGSSHAGREVESKKRGIAKAFSSRRRRPYFGWISSDEEEPINLVQLKPGPIPEKLAQSQSHFVIPVFKNRKRRWDVKPEDT